MDLIFSLVCAQEVNTIAFVKTKENEDPFQVLGSIFVGFVEAFTKSTPTVYKKAIKTDTGLVIRFNYSAYASEELSTLSFPEIGTQLLAIL
jgi:hypothetical protein